MKLKVLSSLLMTSCLTFGFITEASSMECSRHMRMVGEADERNEIVGSYLLPVPLTLAIASGASGITIELIEAGTNINQANSCGETLLGYACAYGGETLLRF